MNDIAVIVLSVVFAWGFLGLLAYLFYHEREERKYVQTLQADLVNLPTEIQKLHAEIAERDNTRTLNMISTSFDKFLGHIERLERINLPQPVTEHDVKSVLSRIGQVADESLEVNHGQGQKNEIESETDKGVELPKDEWTGYINAETKVSFEGEEPPEVVEDHDE